jgi:hypothetical protein
MEEVAPFVLIVQETPSIPISRDYAFLKFNLSTAVPKQILTSHAQPINASLWLFAEYVNAYLNASVRVYHVPSNDWVEKTLMWSNMPPLDTSHFTSKQIGEFNRWYMWNVSTDVANDLRGNLTSSFALAPGFSSWMNYAWFTSKENMTYPPELDLYFREPTLTLTTPFPNVPITIDGSTAQTDKSGSLRVGLLWGIHNVIVPDSIPVQNGVRESFVGWSDNASAAKREINIGNNMTLHANYAKQYRLDVNSLYATVNGSGWYFANETAKVSVQPTWVFTEGLVGLFGARQVFDHWTGACTTSQPNCTLPMDGPKDTTAIWRQDYTIPIAIAAFVAMAAAVLLMQRNRRARHE